MPAPPQRRGDRLTPRADQLGSRFTTMTPRHKEEQEDKEKGVVAADQHEYHGFKNFRKEGGYATGPPSLSFTSNPCRPRSSVATISSVFSWCLRGNALR